MPEKFTPFQNPPKVWPGRYRFTPTRGAAREVHVTFELGVLVAKSAPHSADAAPVKAMQGRFEPLP